MNLDLVLFYILIVILEYVMNDKIKSEDAFVYFEFNAKVSKSLVILRLTYIMNMLLRLIVLLCINTGRTSFEIMYILFTS